MKRRKFLKLIGFSPLVLLMPKTLIKAKPLPVIAKKKVGTYMGNATDQSSYTAITDIGFQPKYVAIL